jgi:Tol biopolymer transport system component
MYLVTRDGRVTTSTGAQSRNGSGFPHWTPDDRHILLQTTPSYGRRIVTFDLAGGRAWELSRPRWDTWFSLSPDGRYLLLTNGRGGFWRSDVVVP